MKNINSIIFDLDGTLWDTSKACAIAWNNIVQRNGINFRKITAADVRSVTGRPHKECIQIVFSGLSDKEISILSDETMDEDTKVIKEQGGVLYEGVRKGLFSLSKSFDLYIVSNCQSGYIENFLSQNKFQNLFKDFLCWGDTNEPKPINTKRIIEKNNLCNPVFVGDMDGDHEAAIKCNIEFIQVTYGFGLPIKNCKSFDNFPQLVDHLI